MPTYSAPPTEGKEIEMGSTSKETPKQTSDRIIKSMQDNARKAQQDAAAKGK